MRVQVVRRWVAVAVGLALLCGLPVIASGRVWAASATRWRVKDITA